MFLMKNLIKFLAFTPCCLSLSWGMEHPDNNDVHRQLNQLPVQQSPQNIANGLTKQLGQNFYQSAVASMQNCYQTINQGIQLAKNLNDKNNQMD